MPLEFNIHFRFYGQLNDFLPRERRQVSFSMHLRQPRSVKDAIESLGIPHVEVAQIVIGKGVVDHGYKLRGDERIAVYPYSRLTPGAEGLSERLLFQVDENLGKLARLLRLIGYDSAYEKGIDDEMVVARAETEKRILLSRDAEILKRQALSRGYYVRSNQPQQQLIEVMNRYQLLEMARPFTRCLTCNGTLISVSRNAVLGHVPKSVCQRMTEYNQCQRCGKVLWKGSHYFRLIQFLDNLPFDWNRGSHGLSRQ